MAKTFDEVVYSLCRQYTDQSQLGFKSVKQLANGFEIEYVNGTKATYTVQNMHQHTNMAVLSVLNKDANGNLTFNGKKITNLTADQEQLLMKFSLSADNKLLFDGKEITPEFLDTTGDGTKFLADDGTYKKVAGGAGGASTADAVEYVNATLNSSNVEEALNKIVSKVYYNELNFDNMTVSNSVAANVDETIIGQEYLGGYIEIQPDSWDGSVCSVDATTKTWGFPMSLLPSEQTRLREDVFQGNGKGLMYLRFPLGFAYRGYRNIDETKSLAKNIGERFKGQNKSLKQLLVNVVEAGGGLAPEYWCPAPFWVTSGTYNGENYISAGGSYSQDTKLSSIKTTDAVQYNAQIEAFTDAIVDDLEYLHQNIAPVRMFSLQNEPTYSTQPYGACKYDKQTYNDVLEVLYPKIQASAILSEYNDEPNEVKLYVASSDEAAPFNGIAKTFIDNHSDMIWGYSHHSMRKASGEVTVDGFTGADWYKTNDFKNNVKYNKTNVFINEYEYFNVGFGSNEFRCSNNMLHLINEAVYGGAKVLHPIIHLCKPLGQTLSSTNTSGYCLFETNLKDSYGVDITDTKNANKLQKGTYATNKWAYNSWKMFGDNLPVNAYLVGDYSNKINGAGWCTYKHGGKLYIFMANNSDKNVAITLTFDVEKNFTGKMYDMTHCGDRIKSKQESSIKFVVPAYSGQCWIEEDIKTQIVEEVQCTSISLDKTSLTFATAETQTLIATFEPSNTTDSITWESSDTSIATVNNGVVTPIGNGSCTITVTCGSKSKTCDVTVTLPTLNSISANYTQGETVIYNTSSLNELKNGLSVMANYSDGSSSAVTNYTLSGTLTVGTSTITVTYNGKTTTFDVTVTEYVAPTENIMNLTLGGINYSTGLDEDNAYKYRSDFVEVTDLNTSIYSTAFDEDIMKKVSVNGFVIRTYDKDKNFLASNPSQLTHVSTGNTGNPITVVFDSGVKYIRFIIARVISATQVATIKNTHTITINNVEYKINIVKE